ncbi:DUF1427 family protein [Streptomyces sp. NBC_00663]|uniref:DUF1427 family protein n=1 Tax=Streptomyces sp. NBC_00663 TaxID=2975801 RepID=UPI002E351A17|nr:DUF1427 family protein [Streptomyces sp. NBC_00663]
MSGAARARVAAFGRRVLISFAAGLAMGALYRTWDLRAPAPALLGLTGLLGIGLGERAATALGTRIALRRAAPRPSPASHPTDAPGTASGCTCVPSSPPH